MNALLVLDMQKGILERKDFTKEKQNILKMIEAFKNTNEIVIFTKHTDNNPESIFYKDSESAEITSDFKVYADYIIEKESPIAFHNTNLEQVLKDNNVEKLYITGFNTEYCCLFTSIAALDRGYQVSFIEDATGTVNDEDIYEMKGLDIKDFVGSVLDWSGVIEVLYFEEFEAEYL